MVIHLLFSVSASLHQDFWYLDLEFCLWLDKHILALFSRSQICLPPTLIGSLTQNSLNTDTSSITLSCFGRLPINHFILNGWDYNIRLFPQTH